MTSQFARTELLIGRDAINRLHRCRVAVFGVGGVGGAAVEALARSGVGTIDVIDDDTFSLSNLNRQLLATRSAIGRNKVDVAMERILAINPAATVNAHRMFFLPGDAAADALDFAAFDYVVDALDTMSAKIEIALRAQRAGVPIISAMGCGNRVDPLKLQISDLYKTHMDPLSKIMRKEMKKRGVKKLTVLFSTEPPIKPIPELVEECLADSPGKRMVPGSTPFVPPVAGYMIASHVVSQLAEIDVSDRVKGGRQD